MAGQSGEQKGVLATVCQAACVLHRAVTSWFVTLSWDTQDSKAGETLPWLC